jgi:hypothetical protein
MEWKKLFSFGMGKARQENVEEMANRLGFSQDILVKIKTIARADLQTFYQKDLYSESTANAAGISFMSNEDAVDEVVLKLQTELKPLGCLAFISERESKKASVAIVKGHDQFDILRIQQTNGENYDISNNKVIYTLKEWHKQYPFTILGAGHDWVEVEFLELPQNKDILLLAQNVYEFCPDIVDQETESIEVLIEEMKKTRKMFFWWD